jgi:hypothetical protein
MMTVKACMSLPMLLYIVWLYKQHIDQRRERRRGFKPLLEDQLEKGICSMY